VAGSGCIFVAAVSIPTIDLRVLFAYTARYLSVVGFLFSKLEVSQTGASLPQAGLPVANANERPKNFELNLVFPTQVLRVHRGSVS
jgi:hypothetical protein